MEGGGDIIVRDEGRAARGRLGRKERGAIRRMHYTANGLPKDIQ